MTATATTNETTTAPLASFFSSPLNPRDAIIAESLSDLVGNIHVVGEVVQPLIVRNGPKDKFEIIDGERRWRAAKIAGVDTLPLIVRNDLTDGQCIEIMLFSSLQKEALTPLAEARGYKSLATANQSLYSLSYIAQRVGKTEKHVADRLRLLDLIEPVKQLLDRRLILVGHAESLAKLKPNEQSMIAAPNGPLFVPEAGNLFNDSNDPYAGKKTITVRELDAYIAKHIRFDVMHAAATAPLDFGEIAKKVETAQAVTGRGRKTVAITYESFVQPSAKSDEERTYGPKSWKRADGTKGTTVVEYPKRKVLDSPTCDHSVLGVFVVGEGRGTGFDVCIAREKCEVHWGTEMKEKAKNAELRAKGHNSAAAARESKADEKRRLEEVERDRQREIWRTICPHLIAESVRQVKGVKTLSASVVKLFERSDSHAVRLDGRHAKKVLGAGWHKQLPAALLVSIVSAINPNWGNYDSFVKDYAKPLGLDIKRLQAVRDKHTPKPKVASTTEETGAKA